ncbi:hypothetical protein M407DRAFT_17842 [Tulasnella calospora MUT 4182]|uniref:DUF6534 domain-containing protein n=1 Tax=Tulasnella calospora MUT 4182 TaxID=1051891 RepID=A0A0C3LH40_9AGAM|nr:hypothetical protein M407DRAFT_17842 [Tulasnella calospora MUT 4182]
MTKPVKGRPPEVIDFMVQNLKADPEGFMGPWFMGLVAITYMMGVIISQVTKYFSTFGYESPRLFLLVVSCSLLSVAQWAVIMIAEWDWCVANYGDWRRFAEVPWEAAAVSVITWLTVFVSQLFFASRCYTLYGRSKLVFGGLLLGMTTCLGIFMFLAAIIAIDPFNFPLIEGLSVSGLATHVATDVAITVLTLWKICQRGKMYSHKTQQGLIRLRNMIVEAAVPPTTCVILKMCFTFGMGKKNLISHWFAIITPTLYVWSMMFTLNSRVAVRQAFNAPTKDEDETLSTGFQFANLQVSTCKFGQAESAGQPRLSPDV